MMAPRRSSESELHAFVDGELTADERAEVEAALASSPQALELVRDVREINDALRQRYAGRLSEPLPPALHKPLARLGRRPVAPFATLARWAAAAAVVMAAGAAGYGARGLLAETRRSEAAFVTTALGAHTVYVPEVRHPVEVKADEAHLVRWLAKRVGADVRAPALGSLGWRLMGGRLLPDQGLPAAQFMYEDASGRRLTLYVRKETGLNNTSFRFHEKDGFGAFYWIDRPLAYALSGRLSRDELMNLANVVYAQLEAQEAGKASGGQAQ
ncbi:MAG: anti-sigma factor [Hyphomonadaceae bacterium]|nr:anti-sigma factor [Hyphomonadaceae bacterium]